jgi:uncharacterized protein YcbK (DUF882 family)
MYKVLVLQNKLPFTLETETPEVVKYFQRYQPEVPIQFEFKTVKIDTAVTPYTTFNGFDIKTGKPKLMKYYGLTSDVKDKCREYSSDKYDAVMFAWDRDTAPYLADGVVTSFTNFKPLFPNTEFIQLAINTYTVQTLKDTWNRVAHELMHAFCFTLLRKGIKVVDEMDITTLPDGRKIPFFRNDDPHAPDGNFANTFENLKPYLSQLTKTETKKLRYFSDKEAHKMYKEFMIFSDELRHRCGFALADSTPNSSFRTPEQNRRAGGVPNSAHLDGKSKDWRVVGGIKKAKLIEEALKLAKEYGIAVGIGVGANFMHLDAYHRKQNTVWNYEVEKG